MLVLGSLIAVGVLMGAAAAWIVARTTNPREIRRVQRAVAACLYEMRLFVDEPGLIVRAQWRLIGLSFSYCVRMLLPAGIIAIAMLFLFPWLEGFYAFRPLVIGEPAVVTLEQDGDQVPILRAPAELAIETPPVRAGREIGWRIRPLRPVDGALEFIFPSQTIAKTVISGSGPRFLSGRRVQSRVDWFWHPLEARLPAGSVHWIEIPYRASGLSWRFWLIVCSMASAFLLRNRV
jgi:hypothetical protein